MIGCDHVTPCGLVEIYKRFKGTHCLHRQEITLNVGAQNYSEARVNCNTLHGNIFQTTADYILSSGYFLFPQSSIGTLGPTEPPTYLYALYTLPFYEDSG